MTLRQLGQGIGSPETGWEYQLKWMADHPGYNPYDVITIDLTVEHTDAEYAYSGNHWAVRQIDSPVYMKLDRKDRAQIDLSSERVGSSPWNTLYFTNAAATGSLVLLIGRASLFSVAPVGASGSLVPVNISQTRWGINVEPSWVFADEVTAPAAGTALVTKAVSAGVSGYIFGILIETQEANDFLVKWTSGGAAKQARYTFSAPGSMEIVDPVSMNSSLLADASTNITINNVTAGGTGMIYQAKILYAEQ